MRPLRYSINVTLDGCVDHRAGTPGEETHRHAAEGIERADALLLGRATYEMMEEAWRPVAQTGVRPDWMPDWMVPFAHTIDAAKKYVVSSTLDRVDWNAELVRGDLGEAVRQLKAQAGKGLATGGGDAVRAEGALNTIASPFRAATAVRSRAVPFSGRRPSRRRERFRHLLRRTPQEGSASIGRPAPPLVVLSNRRPDPWRASVLLPNPSVRRDRSECRRGTSIRPVRAGRRHDDAPLHRYHPPQLGEYRVDMALAFFGRLK